MKFLCVSTLAAVAAFLPTVYGKKTRRPDLNLARTASAHSDVSVSVESFVSKMMASGVATPDDGDQRIVQEKVMEGSPEQINAMLQAQFTLYDKDSSGERTP